MFERIRRRLTLGYVSILALILLLVGVVAVASFSRQVHDQQDELLKQKAKGDADYVRDALLRRYEDGGFSGDRSGEGRRDHAPIGPFQSATSSDIGMVALVPSDEGDGIEGTVLDSTSSASYFGLPFEEPAMRATQEGGTVFETVEEAGGEKVRVASVPVTGRDGEVAVVQAAQASRVVGDMVRSLILILVPVGLLGLLLAGFGGLFLSRRAMQPVRDAFQRQRTFIADASHELKTPLALVKINAEVMQRNPSDPDNREVVEDQLSEIDRMDALLSDLLTLARLDSGRLDVEDKPFDLSVVAAETAGRFLKRAASENIQLEMEIPDELPAHGDPERTAQILAALLDNALRYTPKKGRVIVSGRSLDGCSETSVADNGPGIPKQHLPRIFDRFYRTEEARTRAGGGTGLGLSIARDLARVQGGDLTAENVGGGGAVFRLQLSGQQRRDHPAKAR
jgi:signal transduction histidine kinase